MAAGDILSVTIGAEGWYADVVIEGFGTGGTYNFGLGTNSSPENGTPKIAFTVVSLGYNGATPTTRTRMVYGTAVVRKPFPFTTNINAPVNNEVAGGGNVTIRVALSDHIFAKDNTGGGKSGTAVTVTFLSGWYTYSATPSNATTALTVTNNSSLDYPKVVGNWSEVCHWNKYGNTTTLKCVAFHSSAQSQRPVHTVVFSAADTHGHTATATVTDMTIDGASADAVPVQEYIGSLNTSGFTQGDIVTCNFIAYPWIGDSGSILDTSAGTAQLTPWYGPITGVADPAGTYATSLAVVNPSTGNDGTGVVSTVLATANASPFLTIKGAYDAVRTYNNSNYSRNNAGGSTIYLRTGNHAWMGGTPTLGTTASAWLSYECYPGDAKSGVIISSQSGGKSSGLRTKIKGVTITAQSASGVFAPGAGSVMWLDDCAGDWPTSSQPTLYTIEVVYITRCQFTNLQQGFKQFSNTLSQYALVRGCTLAPTRTFGGATPYVFIGNHRSTRSFTGSFLSDNMVAMAGTSQSLIPAGTSGTITVGIKSSASTYNLKAGTAVIWAADAVEGGVNAILTADVTVTTAAFASCSVNFINTTGHDIPAGAVVSVFGPNAYMTNQIIAYNKIRGYPNGNQVISVRANTGHELHGIAIIGNLVEQLNNNEPSNIMGAAADSTVTYPVNNVLQWHNTFVGQRVNGPYNSEDAVSATRALWSIKNCVYDSLNLKADLFTGTVYTIKNTVDIPAGTSGAQTIVLQSTATVSITVVAGNTITIGTRTFTITDASVNLNTTSGTNVNGTFSAATVGDTPVDTALTVSSENGSRMGNWSAAYGVGCEGAIDLNSYQTGSSGAFPRDFVGINSIEYASHSAVSTALFRNRLSAMGTAIKTLTSIASGFTGAKTLSCQTVIGTEFYPAGTRFSFGAFVTDMILVSDTTFTTTPQNVNFTVLIAPTSTINVNDAMTIPCAGSIRTNTSISGTGAKSPQLFVNSGSQFWPAGTVFSDSATGTMYATLDADTTITTTPTAVNITVVTAPSSTVAVGKYLLNPNEGNGGGDYHFLAASPLLSISNAQILPYDIAGRQRQAGRQSAGAYAPDLTLVSVGGE